MKDYNRFKMGAKMLILGLTVLYTAGCVAIPVIVEEKTPYAENVPDKILLTDRVVSKDYYKGKVVFSANVGTGDNSNYEIFVSDEDGSNQQRITYSRYFDIDPVWEIDKKTGDAKIVFSKIIEEGEYWRIDHKTGDKEIISYESYKSAFYDSLNRKK